MDPDKQEFDRQQATIERQRLTPLDQVKQSLQPVVQAAASGAFGISPNAGQALLNAIHHCQDGLDAARVSIDMIQQETKLGTSPDALVMTKFNKEVAAGGTDSAVTALQGLQAILAQAEASVTEAMKHYRQTDADSASGIRRAGA
jgi:hypothetical protein